MLSVTIDDGAASGYSEGVASGVPLVFGTTDDAAPDAVTDAAGNIHAAFTVGGRLSYLYKPKGAANWQPAIDLGIIGVSTPRIAADPAGNLVITYTTFNEISYIKRPAGSGAWTAPVQLSSLPSGSSTPSDVSADGLGRFHVVWQDNFNNVNDIRYRRIEANGSLSAEFTAGSVGDDRSPRVSANASGGVSLVWNVWNASNQASEIYHASLNPDGLSFSSAARLDATTLRSVEPDVALANDGTVHVAYHDDNNGNWEVAYAKRAAGSGSFTAPQYIPDPGVVDAQVSLALGPDSALHMSWQGTGTLYTATNAGSGWSTPQVLMVEVGASTSSIAVDGFNRTYVLSTVQRTGLTVNNSADLWTWSEPASVVGRKIFYNNSGFDGRNAAQTGLDDNAIATDKVALIPGTGAATFANYTSFDKGINGVMIDVAGLKSTSLSTSDFAFFVGNVNDSSTWAAAPAPAAIGVRPGAGTGGSDRITLTWADGAISKKWLRVQLKATAATGLATPDNFIFGNAVGESGDNALSAFVDAIDFAGARDNPRGFVNPAPVNFRWDYNRDRFVDAIDMATARDNSTGFVNSLKLINPPAIAAPASTNGWQVNNSNGYEGEYRSAASATSGSTAYASYVFTNLPNGTYEIQATWVPTAGNATNAPMSFSVGSGTGRQEFTINQQVAPNGLSSGGRPFQTLGSITVTNNAGAYRVFVYSRGNGPVVADAVRLFQQPTVQDITYNLDAADGQPAKEIDPDVVTDSQGNVHQVYVDGPNTNDNFRAFYRFKAAGSSTWTDPTLIPFGAGGVGGTKIARDSNNNLYVVYHDQNQVWFTSKPAGGFFWTTPVRLSGTYGNGTPRKALWPQIAVDAQNRIHVVWHENTAPAGDSSIYYVFYRIFENGAWQTIEQVNTTTAANSADPDVAVAPDGRAFVTWNGPAPSGNLTPAMFRERNANGGWQAPVTVDSTRSGGTSVTVDSAGNPHVTWIRDTGGGGNAWESAYRSRLAGVWGTTKTFSNPNGVDIEPHLVIKPDNSMTLFWCDYNSIYLARFLNGAWLPTTTTLASNVGAASINATYDPVLDATHMVAGARKLGYTFSDSWDVLYYTE